MGIPSLYFPLIPDATKGGLAGSRQTPPTRDVVPGLVPLRANLRDRIVAPQPKCSPARYLPMFLASPKSHFIDPSPSASAICSKGCHRTSKFTVHVRRNALGEPRNVGKRAGLQ